MFFIKNSSNSFSSVCKYNLSLMRFINPSKPDSPSISERVPADCKSAANFSVFLCENSSYKRARSVGLVNVDASSSSRNRMIRSECSSAVK